MTSFQEVLAGSYSAKAVQAVARVAHLESAQVAGPQFPAIVVCGNGSGTSSLVDMFLHQRLLSGGAPRTSRRPVRCRLTDRRLSISSTGPPEGSGGLRVHERTSSQADLERRRTDPDFRPFEVQVALHMDLAVAALDFVDVSSKALNDSGISLGHYLVADQAPIVLVVVSALEELVDDPPLIRQVLRQLQLHTVSHARTRSKVYLVLSKIDKVVEEDVPVKILDRLLAGLLPAADGVSAETSAGLTAEPCLAAFDGIFAVVSGHPNREPGPEMATYEGTKLESMLAVARDHAEYAPHMATLQTRLGAGALWEHIVRQDLDQHSLRWLKKEQVPRLLQRLEDAWAEQRALPIEHPSMQAVLAGVSAKVDQAAYSFSEPTLDTATLSSLTSGDINPFVNMAGLLAIRRLISRGDFGLQHTPAWASATPQLRKAVLLCGSSSNVMKAAEEAVKEAIQQAFLRPNDAADRLCISRFADLETELTEYVLPAVMHQEQEDHGVYIDSVLQHLIPQWHLPNGPAQGGMKGPSTLTPPQQLIREALLGLLKVMSNTSEAMQHVAAHMNDAA